MLKTLTIAILLGLTSGRPSADSGQEINISEPKSLNYVNREFPNTKENLIAQLEEAPDQKLPFESLLRNRRASNSSAMNNAGTSGASLPNFLQVPLQGIVSVLSTVLLTLLQAIFGLVSGVLNPILLLLTELLNPVLLPLRPVLNPLLLPVNGLLTDILKALNLSLGLSGLLTGNVTSSAFIPSSITRATRSLNSEPPQARRSAEAEGSFTGMPNALNTLVAHLRSKRQSPGTSTDSGVDSTLTSPLTLVKNILMEVMNILVTPLESILSLVISLLNLPIDLISQPLNLVESLLSGTIGQFLPDGITSMLTPMPSKPSTPADTVPNATANSLRQRRSDTNSGLAVSRILPYKKLLKPFSPKPLKVSLRWPAMKRRILFYRLSTIYFRALSDRNIFQIT
ncbi:uncharacterized protein LOC107272040 isoform X2 [Cephus cinctus]|uniref:Uncharacterized protein LOC107272040 isoform X2 n=1 Tax=Cephus cinctus TaxID=211228 RepID=A0AAJ7FR70_CEPCN|nr:uncharacterized protein LOC107272040 isoform X2 [Cephus cinctus]